MLDIVQNSIEAKATLIEIIVIEDIINDIYILEFKDNGCGMNQETVEKVTSPFFTTRNTRKVGLGIPLLKQNSAAANGSLVINSVIGEGTSIKAVFQLSNVDRPPAGNIAETLYLIFMCNPDIRIIYRHKTPAGTYIADSAIVSEVLNGVPLQTGQIKRAVIELVGNSLEEIKASK